MPTTTATTGPPIDLADAVRKRVQHLHSQGVRTFTLADFRSTARGTGRPLAWVADHLIMLEGIGVLRPVRRSNERAWTVSPGTEFLR